MTTANVTLAPHDSATSTTRTRAGRRLLMLSYEYPPVGGGTAMAIRNLLDEFARDPSLHIDLVTSHTGKGIETERLSGNIRVFKLPIPKDSLHFWRPQELGLWILRARRFIFTLAAQEAYELCHCWSGWPSALPAHRLRGRLPYVVSLRGSDVPGYNPRLRWLEALVLRPISRKLWRHAAAVIAVSEHLRSLALRSLPELEIGVIRNGVDLDAFTPAPGDGSTILFVGRLIPRKGVLVLLEALRRMKNHPDARLVIAGDGPERQRLEAACRRYGLDHRVEFRGLVKRPELAELYRQAAIFVLPALEEAMPNVVLEAMAAGLPIVATRTGAAEILRDNGKLVEPGDADGLRAALESYLADSESRHRAGRRSLELARSNAWPAIAAAYRELYESVLERPRVS